MPFVKIHPLLTFLSLLIFTSSALSGVSIRNPNIAFYKSKNSQFASGEATYERLQNNLVSRAEELVKAESEFYQFGEQKISQKLIKPTFAQNLSLSKSYSDIGQFLTLKQTPLKEKAHIQSRSIGQVFEHTKLIPLKYENGFIQVMYQGKKGYIDISVCISKFDYAYAIYAKHPKTQTKQWHYVKTRVFDQIEIMDQTQIPMSAVEGLFANEKLGIITDHKSQLPLWSRVTLKFAMATPNKLTWNQSYISGHGSVWWQSPKNLIASDDSLTIDEILKKDVYSISSHPKEPKKSIISIPEGVYMTDNGTTWTALPQFKKFQGPVYYYNDNMIFVGSSRSTNHGKTFEPFINVGSISSAITRKLGYQPQSVKIKKIKSENPSQISVDVIAGYKTLKLKSMIYNQSWEVVKF
jgi:hypothetical protein